MPKISPFLWFDTQAEEAANLYVSVFPNSKIRHVSRYPEGAPKPVGTAMVVGFELDGVAFSALNGGDNFSFDQAVSFVIDCQDQAEVDHYWTKLGEEGGQPGRCGWLKDRFGLSWQVVPRQLPELLTSGDRAQSGRVMAAMMQMGKLDIAKLQEAAAA